VIAALAARYPAVRFYLGRWQDWQPCYVSRRLVSRFNSFARSIKCLRNIVPVRRFDRQADFWSFLHAVDIGFSTAYHESFGLAMLEQAFAGAACVVPDQAVYPEIHGGSLIVPHSHIADGVSRLLEDSTAWRHWARTSYRNALLYDVGRSAITLAALLDATVSM